MTRFLTVLLGLLLVGCASTPSQQSYPVIAMDVEDESIDESILEAQEQALQKMYSKLEQQSSSSTKKEQKATAQKKEIVYTMDTRQNHPKVKKWVRYYSQKDRERFQRFLNRGARYKRLVQNLLIDNGLPPELYYLGILESGYVIKARSHAGAVGAWQFMAPTGRQYGLKINNYVDERQDPIRSTLAAVRYLKELYRQKKSWNLALAAYNAGPGRVRRAMRRGRNRDYWKLTRRRLLPYDTREYVPQFLAIVSIGKNLEKYNFEEKTDKPLKPMELVKVPSPVSMSKIAEITGVSQRQLKKMNKHLLKAVTPPNKNKNYHIWVPWKSIDQVKEAYDQLAQHRIKGLKVQRYLASSRGTRYHRVRRGQNLGMIARRYGTSVAKLKKLNGLKKSRIFIGQRLKVRGGGKKRVGRVQAKSYHRVRKGENLHRIAKKYGLSVKNLKKYNGLKSGKIFVGQKLKVRKLASKSAKSKWTSYKVRRGDSLYKIAKKFGMSLSLLKKINNLSGNGIKYGQFIKVAALGN